MQYGILTPWLFTSCRYARYPLQIAQFIPQGATRLSFTLYLPCASDSPTANQSPSRLLVGDDGLPLPRDIDVCIQHYSIPIEVVSEIDVTLVVDGRLTGELRDD
jgi:hypothetical protein